MSAVAYLRAIGYGFYLIHAKNEQLGGPQYWARHVKMGSQKGVSDLIVLYPSNGYHGLIIEFKSSGKKPTKQQAEFLNRMETVGYFSFWSDNIDYTKQQIDNYFKKNDKKNQNSQQSENLYETRYSWYSKKDSKD